MFNKLCWSKGTPNWGDDCNPFLFEFISGYKPELVKLGAPKTEPHYMMVGSILHYANPNTHVWGTGLRFSDKPLKKPAKIYAVRGPLTRDILIKHDIECPEVYGDPVLLLPRFYSPKIEKKYKLGVIPHYIDKRFVKINEPGVLQIDIQGSFYDVIDAINSCEKIISSSLHGLILADAYGIPAMWLKISDKVEGAELKFNDYFLSVKREPNKFIDFNSLHSITDALKYFYDYKIDVDLDKLYSVCPFKGEKVAV